MKKTHEKFVEEAKEKMPGYVVLGPYLGANSKIKVLHEVCGTIWWPWAGAFISGHGCPHCRNTMLAKRYAKTQEKFVHEMAEKMPGYTILGTYKNDRTPIETRHDECGTIWFPLPTNLLRGEGCPKCRGKKISKTKTRTHEEFVAVVAEKMPGYTVLGIYNGKENKIAVRHDFCGTVWEPFAGALVRGHGCPHCKQPHGEKRIVKILQAHHIDFKEQYKFLNCKSKRQLPFDFYLPKFNLAVEYDGEQHFRPIERFGGIEGFNRCLERDKIKTDYCAANGIKLVRIRYDDDIEKVLGEALGW